MKNIQTIFNENKVYDYDTQAVALKENLIEGSLDAELVVYYTVANGDALPEELRAFLMKLLGAAKHDLTNTLIINDRAGIKFNQLVKGKKAKKLFVFGTTRKVLGINLNIKRYKMYALQGIESIFVDRLDILEKDTKRKGAMWSLMKTMFNIG